MKDDPRLIAMRILRPVILQQRSLNQAFDKYQNHPHVAAIKALCFDCCRYYFPLSVLADQLMEKPLPGKHGDLYLFIVLGLLELRYHHKAQHAVVSQIVQMCQSINKRWAKGLVNAVLRRYLREHESLHQQLDENPVYTHAHPQWMIDQTKKDWPHQWQEILAENNKQAPMVLRVNKSRTSLQHYMDLCRQNDVDASPVVGTTCGLRLAKPLPVYAIPGFDQGMVSVQDGSAQLVDELLEIRDEMRVLDACAAPGGKTAMIAEQHPDCQITAIDVDKHRVQTIDENIKRLGLRVMVKQADATRVESWWDHQTYARILIDAPCSGSGVIRRHPDIKLLRRQEDIQQLSHQQLALLIALWPLLQAGGILVYCTCSVWKAENDEVIDLFLKATVDAKPMPIELPWGCKTRHGWQTRPGEACMDGFYFAKIAKTQS